MSLNVNLRPAPTDIHAIEAQPSLGDIELQVCCTGGTATTAKRIERPLHWSLWLRHTCMQRELSGSVE